MTFFSPFIEVDSTNNKEGGETAEEMASFTSQPPGDLHRPRPVRQASPELSVSRALSSPLGYDLTSSPMKKACQHTSTGQHLHQQCPARSLSHGLPVITTGKAGGKGKTVTFHTEARLIGPEYIKLPVVFETDQEEDSVSLLNKTDDVDGSQESLMASGFVNVPCSRRGFCLELLPSLIADKLDSSCDPDDQVDGGRALASPEGYDWQPSYVNLEDTEIAPVLLASSRPADDSSDFWKPKSVASGNKGRRQPSAESGCSVDEPLLPSSPLSTLTTEDKNKKNRTEALGDNPLLMEFPGFRYGIQLPAGVGGALERRSISNGSSGSDTQVRNNRPLVMRISNLPPPYITVRGSYCCLLSPSIPPGGPLYNNGAVVDSSKWEG